MHAQCIIIINTGINGLIAIQQKSININIEQVKRLIKNKSGYTTAAFTKAFIVSINQLHGLITV